MNLTEKSLRVEYLIFLGYKKRKDCMLEAMIYTLHEKYHYTTFAHLTLNRVEKVFYMPLQ